MSKQDKPLSEVSPSDPLKLPIDWFKVLVVSVILSFASFFAAAFLHFRSLFVIADLLIGFSVVLGLTLVFIALVKLFSTTKK